MFSGSLTLSVLSQCLTSLTQVTPAEEPAHGCGLEDYRSPVGAVYGMTIPTTYPTSVETTAQRR